MAYALSTNGSGYASKANTSGLATGNFDLTFTLWVNVQTAPTSGNQKYLFTLGPNGSYTGFSIRYKNNAGTYQLGWENGVTAMLANSGTLTTNTWFFLAFKYTASTKVLSFSVNDGAFVNTAASGSNMALPANAIFELGATYGNVNYVGYFDDFRYFESLLSAGDITAIYNSGNGSPTAQGTEKMWFKLENNYTDSGSTANNLSAAGSGNTFVAGKVPDASSTTYDSNFFGAGI